MIDYIIISALAMAVLYLPYVIFFRNHTFFGTNRLYLIGSLAVALAVPSMPGVMPVNGGEIPEVALPVITIGAEIAEASSAGTNGIALLPVLYAIVALVLIVRLIAGLVMLYLMIQTGAKRKLDGFTLVEHERISSPFSFFRIIFLPVDSFGDEADLRKIITHEKAHGLMLHSLDTTILEILRAVFWINPMIHVYARSLKTIHEYQADRSAGESDLTAYARLLLSRVNPAGNHGLTHAFFPSQIKNRITMMMKKPTEKRAILSYLLAIPFMMFAVALSSWSFPADAPPEGDQVEIPVQVTADTVPAKQQVFKVVEQMPAFPGCKDVSADEKKQCSFEKLTTYMIENLRYPEEAKKEKIEGRVIVKFVVEPTGIVSGIKVVRGLHPACDAEVIRLIEATNSLDERWTPGMQRGKKVPVELTLPVQFAL